MRPTLPCLVLLLLILPASPAAQAADAAEIDFSGPIGAACRDLAAEAGSDPAHCVVQESGSYGRLDGLDQVYALYCLDAPGREVPACEVGAIALFRFDRGSGAVERWLQRVDDEAPGNRFRRPELV